MVKIVRLLNAPSKASGMRLKNAVDNNAPAEKLSILSEFLENLESKILCAISTLPIPAKNVPKIINGNILIILLPPFQGESAMDYIRFREPYSPAVRSFMVTAV